MTAVSRTPTYRSWSAARRRCFCKTAKDYPRYGGAGVTMCLQWATSYLSFLKALGERPAGTTLERINGAKGYEPGNCKWATPAEQAANRKSTRLIGGIPAAHYAAKLGMTPAAMYKRLNKGKSLDHPRTQSKVRMR